jgi:hypothetical protein
MPPLLDLPAGARVFVDANVLAYHFAEVLLRSLSQCPIPHTL